MSLIHKFKKDISKLQHTKARFRKKNNGENALVSYSSKTIRKILFNCLFCVGRQLVRWKGKLRGTGK